MNRKHHQRTRRRIQRDISGEPPSPPEFRRWGPRKLFREKLGPRFIEADLAESDLRVAAWLADQEPPAGVMRFSTEDMKVPNRNGDSFAEDLSYWLPKGPDGKPLPFPQISHYDAAIPLHRTETGRPCAWRPNGLEQWRDELKRRKLKSPKTTEP